MMLSVQNNFGCMHGPPGQPLEAVPFTEPNTPGNGLIVVAYFLCALQNFSANLEIADSAGNSYQSIGACGIYDRIRWTSLLQIWYVRSCAGGSNVVTVTETTDTEGGTFLLAVSVFEYMGAFGAVDGSSFATGLVRPNITLSLITTVGGDLLFGFGTQYGIYGTVTLDSNSRGYTTEQAETILAWDDPYSPIVPILAVDKIEAAVGLKSVIFDYTQSEEGLDTALLVALFPASASSGPPAPPPVSGSAAGWPTIF